MHGYELWISEVTGSWTSMVKDINWGSSLSVDPRYRDDGINGEVVRNSVVKINNKKYKTDGEGYIYR
ncbi:MAG TPA: hypothetical protein PLL26_03575 [Candidatus Dojkabacteria bacterium]|nr:hypothetical protein [Candidatus Dojkabacteria bacterium]